MEYWLYLSYILTITAIIITPGPNAILMISHSLNFGDRAVISNALGSISASFLLILLSLVGIKTFISDNYLLLFTLLGALYLAYLGFTNIRTKTIHFDLSPTHETRGRKRFFFKLFLQGSVIPKIFSSSSFYSPNFLILI